MSVGNLWKYAAVTFSLLHNQKDVLDLKAAANDVSKFTTLD